MWDSLPSQHAGLSLQLPHVAARLTAPSSLPACPPAEAHDHAKYAYNTHGHKFDFLLKPLPPTDEEELEAAAPCQACGATAVLPHMNCANIDCNKLFLACDACKVCRQASMSSGCGLHSPLQVPAPVPACR